MFYIKPLFRFHWLLLLGSDKAETDDSNHMSNCYRNHHIEKESLIQVTFEKFILTGHSPVGYILKTKESQKKCSIFLIGFFSGNDL